MKIIRNTTLLFLVSAFLAFGQANVLTQTTLAAAMTASARDITLTSSTGVSVPGIGTVGTQLFVVDSGQVEGEVMTVLALTPPNTTGTYRVQRTTSKVVAHAAGAMVLLGAPNLFYKGNPTGTCTSTSILVTPWVNTNSGLQWLCSSITGTWVPGFGNTSAPAQATTAVSSATAAMVPSGPLFHISGSSAMTSITVPVGAANGSGFCAIWDSTASTTHAGDIGKTTSGAAGIVTCWTYSPADGLYYPTL